MRPVGEISTAILSAAEHLTKEEGGERRGHTLQELAQEACVGIQAARRTVDNMCRAGKLERVAERKVTYRNRPVVEYALPAPTPQDEVDEPSYIDVATIFTFWAQG